MRGRMEGSKTRKSSMGAGTCMCAGRSICGAGGRTEHGSEGRTKAARNTRHPACSQSPTLPAVNGIAGTGEEADGSGEVLCPLALWIRPSLWTSKSPFMIKGHKRLTRKEPLEAGDLPQPRDGPWVCLNGIQVWGGLGSRQRR